MYTIAIFYQEIYANILFISQCFDWFQSGSSECRENTEKQTDKDGESNRHQNGLHRNDSLDDIFQSEHNDITQKNTYDSTD